MTKATNSAVMRMKNEKMILSLIREMPVSRAEIAHQTGLSKAAVTGIVEELAARGIVAKQPSPTGTVGRTPLRLSVNSHAVLTIGVNITRSEITLGAVDLAGRIRIKETLPVASPAISIPAIAAHVQKIKQALFDLGHLCKISVVTPGPVADGRVQNPPGFGAWHGFPVADALAEAVGYPVLLGNVSGATALAEHYFGAARDTENFLALLVDDGIGAGLVLGNELFLGPCELGHITVCYDGERCECGNVGCLERYAAIPHILDGSPYAGWREAVDAADSALLLREAEYISAAAVSAGNLFALDTILLCGEISYRADGLIALIEERIKARRLARTDLRVLAGGVTDKLLVAASLGFYDFFR